ncbi:hypothetical protein GCM10009776_14930 [Microbacterium deminutum]|uniref:Glycosyltransferase 2-like domain-containing protein n=2 Tax=Microbacterium deminutum TaxID=344164 RepID=A0ABN2QM04_9MICO
MNAVEPGALSGAGLSEQWRAYVDAHATRGVLLRMMARLAPTRLRPLAVVRRPPVSPTRRIRASVIVPCHNYGHYLEEAVNSVLSQEGVEVEVIIVDDVSTDDSLAVARELAVTHPEVRVIINEHNVGHVRSFNAGWATATGDVIVKLDADDLLAPGSLARAAALFEQRPDVGLVYGYPRHFEHPAVPKGSVGDTAWTIWRGQDWFAERCKHGTSVITTPEMALRASLLREHGALDPDLRYTPDLGISLRLATVSNVGHIDNADQAFHREHSASMSVNEGAGEVVDLEARRDAFDRVFSSPNVKIANADGLRGTVRRALALDAMRDAASLADRPESSARTDGLEEFARATWPDSAYPKSWDTLRVGRKRLGPISRIGGLARRVARRVRNESYYVRWVVKGF